MMEDLTLLLAALLLTPVGWAGMLFVALSIRLIRSS